MRKINVRLGEGVVPYTSETMVNTSPKTTATKGSTMIQRLQRLSLQEERERQDSSSISNDHRSRYDVGEQELVSRNRIRLHVYDLIIESAVVPLFGVFELPVGQIFSALNSGLHTLGTGAYHVGVEVNGIEYAFGANEYEGITGVFTCAPMTAPGFQYRTTIDFGDRKPRFTGGKYSKQDARGILQGMASEYMGKEYDLLRKNCCTFAHDACVRLGIEDKEIPTWFRNLAEAGKVTQDAASSFTSLFEPSDEELMAAHRRRR